MNSLVIRERARQLEAERDAAVKAMVKAELAYSEYCTVNSLPMTSSLNRHPDFKRYSESVDVILKMSRSKGSLVAS